MEHLTLCLGEGGVLGFDLDSFVAVLARSSAAVVHHFGHGIDEVICCVRDECVWF